MTAEGTLDDWEGERCPRCGVRSQRFRDLPNGGRVCWKCWGSGLYDYCPHIAALLDDPVLGPRVRRLKIRSCGRDSCKKYKAPGG
ncbi:hypothetical protein caldi_29310 [Caldinitratiruptor microaerophilus]|uniref:Uncharacterized protein n=1 Tax=Caldinitratiruptor microaerophilus TaxID=671077 RepID=A0AA35CQ05_9FIRM|nr:hypothetical protein caldi_29310 [Caldinitratiruptor microaerophilus]